MLYEMQIEWDRYSERKLRKIQTYKQSWWKKSAGCSIWNLWKNLRSLLLLFFFSPMLWTWAPTEIFFQNNNSECLKTCPSELLGKLYQYVFICEQYAWKYLLPCRCLLLLLLFFLGVCYNNVQRANERTTTTHYSQEIITVLKYISAWHEWYQHIYAFISGFLTKKA